MNSGAGESQEKPRELVFHNIHEHGVEIADMWINEVEARSNGRVRFKKSSGEDPEIIKAADIVRDVPALSSRYPLLNLVQIRKLKRYTSRISKHYTIVKSHK
jgi:hypothetical protein